MWYCWVAAEEVVEANGRGELVFSGNDTEFSQKLGPIIGGVGFEVGVR